QHIGVSESVGILEETIVQLNLNPATQLARWNGYLTVFRKLIIRFWKWQNGCSILKKRVIAQFFINGKIDDPVCRVFINPAHGCRYDKLVLIVVGIIINVVSQY